MSSPDQDELDSVAETVRSRSRTIAVDDVVVLFESTDSANRETVTHLLGTMVTQDSSRARRAIRSLVSLLDRSDTDLRSEAVTAIGEIGSQVPHSLDSAIDPLIECLDDDAFSVRLNAVAALSEAAGTYPNATASAVPRLGELLEADLPALGVHATSVLRTLAGEVPRAVSIVSPELLETIESQFGDASETDDESPGRSEQRLQRFGTDTRAIRTTLRRNVAATLVEVVEDDPDTLLASTQRIVDVAKRETDTTVVLSWLTVLGLIAERYPSEVRPAIGFLVECLRESDDDSVIGKATWVCSLLADTLPETISDELQTVLPTIIESLKATPQAQVPAVSVLAYVAEHHPEQVRPARGVLCDLLDSDYPSARTGAALTLGFVGDDAVLPSLERLHEDDSHPNVRHAAEKSIELIRERNED